MLNSPAEDFSKTTLASVFGTLAKLQYLAALRQQNGQYFHWGMARQHGETNANLVISQAHTDLFLTTLRTPIVTLWEDAKSVAEEHGADLKEYLAGLLKERDALIPRDLRGGTGRHFNSVLLGLCSLAEAEARKSDPGA